jgi:hypothetical protein
MPPPTADVLFQVAMFLVARVIFIGLLSCKAQRTCANLTGSRPSTADSRFGAAGNALKQRGFPATLL